AEARLVGHAGRRVGDFGEAAPVVVHPGKEGARVEEPRIGRVGRGGEAWSVERLVLVGDVDRGDARAAAGGGGEHAAGNEIVLVVGVEVAHVQPERERAARAPGRLQLRAFVDLLAGIQYRGEVGRRTGVLDELLHADLRV